MSTSKFTYQDYYSASQSRSNDLKHLRNNEASMIFSLYCAGLCVELMLRAYIGKHTNEFDSRHNLVSLYEKSQFAKLCSEKDREAIDVAIKKVNNVWNNNLRFTSEKRMKRIISHEFVNYEYHHKDFNKFLKNYYSDFFISVDFILKKGQEKWT